MSRPLVTMVVGCFNQGQFVRECLDSVLKQDYPSLQVILFDDCSRDRSVETIRAWLAEHPHLDWPLLVHDRNQGLCASLNEVFSHVRGQYFCHVAADDVALPQRVSHQVAVLDAEPPETAVVYANGYIMDESGRPTGVMLRDLTSYRPPPSGDIFLPLLRQFCVPAATVLMRTDAIRAVGGWDADLVYEDWDMSLRLARRYRFVYLDEVVAGYRRQAASLEHVLNGDLAAVHRKDVTNFKLHYKHLGASPEADRIIHDRLWSYAGSLYKSGYADSYRYLRLNWERDRSWRSTLLTLLAWLHVPWHWFEGLRRWLQP